MRLNVGEREYRALSRLSYSFLKPLASFHEDEAFMKFQQSIDTPFKGSDATELGTAIHNTLQGQPEKVIFAPFINGTTDRKAKAEQKIQLAALKLQDPEIIILDESQKPLMDLIVKNFKKNPDIQAIMKTLSGVEVAYTGDIGRHKVKGKLDFIHSNSDISDAKSISGKFGTDGLDMRSIINRIESDHYDVQAVVYRELRRQAGEGVGNYNLLFISTVSGQVRPIKLSARQLEIGSEKLERIMSRYDKYLLGTHKDYYSLEEV